MNTAIFAWLQHQRTVSVITIITIITSPPLPHWTLAENAWHGLVWHGLVWLGLVCKDTLTNIRVLYGDTLCTTLGIFFVKLIYKQCSWFSFIQVNTMKYIIRK